MCPVEVRYWQPYRLSPLKCLAPLWPPHSKKLAPPLLLDQWRRAAAILLMRIGLIIEHMAACLECSGWCFTFPAVFRVACAIKVLRFLFCVVTHTALFTK